MSAPPTLSLQDLASIKRNIDQIRVAMLTTQDPGGQLRTRPMATHQLDADGTMWFFTHNDSNKVSHIRQQPNVALGFSNPQTQVSVAISGQAQIVSDQARVNQLWDDALLDWFPEGKDDPNIVLLKVTIASGECWE